MDTPRSSPLPRVLLLEDDAVSAAFLADAIAMLPAEVDVATDAATARQLARRGAYDAWLFDAEVADGDALGLLHALRAAGRGAAALAHTADPLPARVAALEAGGFLAVLAKPLRVDVLHAVLHDALRGTPAPGVAEPALSWPADSDGVWDDAAARRVSGDDGAVRRLRALLLRELPAVEDTVLGARVDRDRAGLRLCLHRLRAACGFTGAARLGHAATRLARHPSDDDAWQAFLAALEATRRAPVG